MQGWWACKVVVLLYEGLTVIAPPTAIGESVAQLTTAGDTAHEEAVIDGRGRFLRSNDFCAEMGEAGVDGVAGDVARAPMGVSKEGLSGAVIADVSIVVGRVRANDTLL